MERYLINKAWLRVFSYLLVSVIFFIFIAYYALIGEMDFQFYADSKTYEEAARFQNIDSLVDVGGNFLGPVTILSILGPRNYWGIFFFNIVLFLFSMYFISREKGVSLRVLFFLIMISPITFTSLFSINKEIISLLCICMLIYNHRNKSIVVSLFILLFSYLVRWQFSLFYLMYLFFFSKLNFLKEKRLLSFLLLLVLISVVLYYTKNSLLSGVFNIYERTSDEYTEGSGSFNVIMDVQNDYGYIFAFFPKVLHLMIGMITRYKMIFDYSDVYNNIILYFQAPLNFYLLYVNLRNHLLNMRNDYLFVALLYCAVFAITPIYAIRYFYPVSILLAYSYAARDTILCPISTKDNFVSR